MHIIKITGAQGAGKSEALGHLAELHQSTVITGAQLMAALPLLNSRTSALALNTFVDDVQPEMLSKITKLAKLYPATYRIYLAGRDI